MSPSAADIPRYRNAAERLHQLAGRLRAKASRAEDLLDPVRGALGDRTTWQGAYSDQVRETMTLWANTVRRNADNLRDRARFLDTVADGYETTADALARVQSQAGV